MNNDIVKLQNIRPYAKRFWSENESKISKIGSENETEIS